MLDLVESQFAVVPPRVQFPVADSLLDHIERWVIDEEREGLAGKRNRRRNRGFRS
jgi:hypothetical protein